MLRRAAPGHKLQPAEGAPGPAALLPQHRGGQPGQAASSPGPGLSGPAPVSPEVSQRRSAAPATED